MLNATEHKKAADILMGAEQARKQTTQLSTTFPKISFEDAYAISAEVNRRKIEGGAKLVGYKVGLTSKAMQRSSQINEPDYGYLLDQMMIADGGRVPRDQYCIPRIEVELAFVLGKPLKGPGVGIVHAL